MNICVHICHAHLSNASAQLKEMKDCNQGGRGERQNYCVFKQVHLVIFKDGENKCGYNVQCVPFNHKLIQSHMLLNYA